MDPAVLGSVALMAKELIGRLFQWFDTIVWVTGTLFHKNLFHFLPEVLFLWPSSRKEGWLNDSQEYALCSANVSRPCRGTHADKLHGKSGWLGRVGLPEGNSAKLSLLS